MDSNNISISSEKEKVKNYINTSSINPNKFNNNQGSLINNTTEDININDNNSNINSCLNILNFINEMPFENLSDFYDIESSLFLKRVEKLNLKFFWTSECVLNQQDIKYPYNKLFLILFKQISLYIEEIARLNKQLKQKNRNEKYYQIKIAQIKQKEKENILNKQMLKNLQRDNKLLEKNSYLSNDYYLNNKNKEKKYSNSIDSASNKKYKNNNDDIVNQGIIQCNEEIENLELIEDILKEFKNKNINNNNYKNNILNNVVNRNDINTNKKKKEKYYNKSGIPIKKNVHLSYKSDEFLKK